MSGTSLRRIVRRELHSPRTTAMFVVTIVAAAGLLYLALEAVLALSGRPAALWAPSDMIAWAATLPQEQPSWAVALGGAAAVVVGLVLLVVAITPGRRSRHAITAGSRAVIADNGVIASALSRHLSEELGLAPAAVVVGVGHRVADVTVTPETGLAVDRRQVKDAATAELDRYGVTPPLKTVVRVARKG